MTFLDWVPAISTTSLFAAGLWLLRSLIITRLRASVRHEFNQKIENLKSSLRESEESFKSELRLKETQIEALRSGALSGLASRQAVLDERRILAVDQIWSAVQRLAPAKSISSTMAILKFKEALKLSASKQESREMFKSLSGKIDYQKVKDTKEAETARPFLSDMAWALYSAYQSILAVAMIKMHMLEYGVDTPNMIDLNRVKKVLTAALPHQAEFINSVDTGAYHYLLDELEASLLNELRTFLRGEDVDRSTLEQAATILSESESLQASLASPGDDLKRLMGDELNDILKK